LPFALIKLAESQGVSIEYWPFKPPLQAVYLLDKRLPRPIIGLSEALFENRRLFRCILAEEFGHHFTSVGHCVSATYFNYSDRLKVSKAEHQALRWAARYLIPYQKLVNAVRQGIITRWELAEHFDVTEQMVEFRLSLLRTEGRWIDVLKAAPEGLLVC